MALYINGKKYRFNLNGAPLRQPTNKNSAPHFSEKQVLMLPSGLLVQTEGFYGDGWQGIRFSSDSNLEILCGTYHWGSGEVSTNFVEQYGIDLYEFNYYEHSNFIDLGGQPEKEAEYIRINGKYLGSLSVGQDGCWQVI